jgi:GNAT superfamily N-acetyltransferase
MAVRTRYDVGPKAADEFCSLYEPHPAWGERTREDVFSIIEGSDEVVGLWDTDVESFVASARVLTDYHVQAMIYDVIVASSRRREGLGQRVMQAIADHPALEDVTLTLHCREGLVPFYEQCGYELHDRDLEAPDGSTFSYRTMLLHRDEDR